MPRQRHTKSSVSRKKGSPIRVPELAPKQNIPKSDTSLPSPLLSEPYIQPEIHKLNVNPSDLLPTDRGKYSGMEVSAATILWRNIRCALLTRGPRSPGLELARCPICLQLYKRSKSNLTRHAASHLNEIKRPYKCGWYGRRLEEGKKTCLRRFAQRSHRSNHERNAHKRGFLRCGILWRRSQKQGVVFACPVRVKDSSIKSRHQLDKHGRPTRTQLQQGSKPLLSANDKIAKRYEVIWKQQPEEGVYPKNGDLDWEEDDGGEEWDELEEENVDLEDDNLAIEYNDSDDEAVWRDESWDGDLEDSWGDDPFAYPANSAPPDIILGYLEDKAVSEVEPDEEGGSTRASSRWSTFPGPAPTLSTRPTTASMSPSGLSLSLAQLNAPAYCPTPSPPSPLAPRLDSPRLEGPIDYRRDTPEPYSREPLPPGPHAYASSPDQLVYYPFENAAPPPHLPQGLHPWVQPPVGESPALHGHQPHMHTYEGSMPGYDSYYRSRVTACQPPSILAVAPSYLAATSYPRPTHVSNRYDPYNRPAEPTVTKRSKRATRAPPQALPPAPVFAEYPIPAPHGKGSAAPPHAPKHAPAPAEVHPPPSHMPYGYRYDPRDALGVQLPYAGNGEAQYQAARGPESVPTHWHPAARHPSMYRSTVHTAPPSGYPAIDDQRGYYSPRELEAQREAQMAGRPASRGDHAGVPTPGISRGEDVVAPAWNVAPGPHYSQSGAYRRPSAQRYEEHRRPYVEDYDPLRPGPSTAPSMPNKAAQRRQSRPSSHATSRPSLQGSHHSGGGPKGNF